MALAVLGALTLAGHARLLGARSVSTPAAQQQERAVHAFQRALPGIAFEVGAQPGVSTSLHPDGALLIAAGMQAAAPVRVDLCSQLREPERLRLHPLRIGYRFDDVRRWLDGATPQALRNVLLVDPAAAGDMPEVVISGSARADFTDPLGTPLQLNWTSRSGETRWLGDASLGQVEQGATGQVGLRQQGWLIWGAGGAQALRIERRASALCPQAGELLLQRYRRGAAGAALVVAFPARGQALSAELAAGPYRVPQLAAAPLEDQTLFQALQARGLLRLGADGAAELVPRDLPQWRAAPATGKLAGPAGWEQVTLDPAALRLMHQLYVQPDGAYVRQQLELFNSERRLLAWRVRAGGALAALPWRAEAGSAPAVQALPLSAQMPATAVRLFSSLPQGWLPWSRVARWPAAASLHLALDLPQPASGGERLQLLLAGRVTGASGARLQWRPACSGRACASADQLQEVTLELLPGARGVRLDVGASDVSALAEQQSRHVRLAGGQLVWRALATRSAPAARAAGPAPVQLQDRHGTLLWADGAPTPAARAAGLATLLGVNGEHGGSVAGMLARLPADARHSGTLTLDLPLQTLSQQVLDCVGMRRGRWDGARCSGGAEAPAGRHAGLLVLDTENGDVLAAAGAGTGVVDGANWSEVRDFDRSNPARSALRLPALQHDGGVHQSPGSTFKVISALGLELAASRDAQLDSLLGGLPLERINRLAQQRGYAFQTGAASYPLAPQLAHITNYREQALDRRAQQGRLGLAQALTYSLNTWFAWTAELSDRTLLGRSDGGAPDVQALDPAALDSLRPIVAAAHRLGFEQAMRLDGGLLPADFRWSAWDALQATPSHIDTIHTRHELRQMAIGLRMQATPLQMALAAGAIGQGGVIAPRLLLALDGRASAAAPATPLGIRLDRIRAGMKGVVDGGTGAAAFGAPALAALRPGLSGKTGTAPSGEQIATVWFTGWLEPGSLPGQRHRLALAAFVSHSEASGGDHAAPVVAALLATLAGQRVEQSREQKGK